MPTLTLSHAGGSAGNGFQSGWWTAVGAANVWDCVVSSDGTTYVAGVNVNTNNNPLDSNIDLGIGPYYTNAGLTPGTVINSITQHIVHRNNDAFARPSTFLAYYSQVTGTPYYAAGNPSLPGSVTWRDDSVVWTVNPETGVAWTYEDLFTEQAGVGNGYNRFIYSMNDNGHAYASYQIDRVYLVVDTAPVPWWKLMLPTITGYLSQLAQPIDYVLPFDIFSGGVFYPTGTVFPWITASAPTDKGWWMSNADAFAGAPFVIDSADRPQSPRGFTEMATFATGSTNWCSGFPGPAAGFANHLLYAKGGYVVGTDSPTLRIYDGLFDRPIATIPNTSANAVPKAVVTTLTANGVVYVATFDSGTSSADWVGRVFSLNVENGQMTPMGAPLPAGHLPYALCWHAGRLWCGTHRQSSAASGKVFYIRPGIDADWTVDYDLSTSSVANCSSLCSFQGKLYVGTTGAAGTFAKVLVRDTAGAYTTSLTLSGGAATANNGVPALAEFSNKLYATYYNADTPVVASIRKYDGTSWSVAYTGSGSTLVPFVGLPTDLSTLLAIGGGVGTAAVLLKTADGTTWTDQSVFLSQSSPSSAGLPAFAVVVH